MKSRFPTRAEPTVSARRSVTPAKLSKLLLVVGFGVLASTLLLPELSVGNGYALSIYTGTPVVFWTGIATSTGIALALSFHTGVPRAIRSLALFLGGLSFCAVLSLPLAKGFYYLGEGDSMSHLGWIKDIAAGRLSVFDFMYPGIHTLSLFVQELSGLSARRSTLVVVLLFAILFVVFVPLCVSVLTDNRWAAATGLFSAMLFLPVNNVSVHYFAHPTTQAIMFTPLVLYVTLRYLDDGTAGSEGTSGGPASGRVGAVRSAFGDLSVGWGTAVAVCSASIVVIHPQQAANIVAIFATICLLQLLSGRLDRLASVANHNRLYLQTALLSVVFTTWSTSHDRVTNISSQFIQLVSTSAGEQAGNEAAQRSASLAQIGGSIEGLFFKLFFVSVVFTLLTGALFVWTVLLDRRLPGTDSQNGLVRCLALALVPLLGIHLFYFVSGMTTQHYRQIGFLHLLATILGAVVLAQGAITARDRLSFPTVYTGLFASFGVFLLLTTPVLYASPLIFQPSPEVMETKMVGYERSFAHAETDIEYVGLRAGPHREIDAIYGVSPSEGAEVPGDGSGLPGTVFREGNYSEYYDESKYLAVSEKDRLREVGIYKGFRYPQDGFERLDESPGLHRVMTNGDFRVYLVDEQTATGSSAAAVSTADVGQAGVSAPRRQRERAGPGRG